MLFGLAGGENRDSVICNQFDSFGDPKLKS